MKHKFNIISIGIILIIISIFSYIFYKAPLLEKKIKKTLISQSHDIVKFYIKSIKNKAGKSINNTNLIYQIVQKNKNIALFTIIHNGSVLIANKNNKYLSSNNYQSITHNFLLKKEKLNKYNSIVTKYFNNKKFYIYYYKIGPKTLLIAYAYQLSLKLLVNLALELIAILTINIIFCMFLYMAFKPVKKIQSIDNNKNKLDNDDIKIIIKKENTNKCKERDLKEIFKKMYISEQLSSISLTVYNNTMPNIKYKYNHLRDELYKYEDNNINIESQKDLIKELKNGFSLYIDRNKKIIIPLISKNKLSASLNVSSYKAFSGYSLQNIKQNNLKILSALPAKI